MPELSVIILTYNEARNIRKCLESLRGLTEAVFVVDSGSTDETASICREHGVEVHEHPFTSHAEQFNWGLDNLPLRTDWVMRLDADEEVTPELATALQIFLASPPAGVTGINVRRRVYFLGRWIRHGGYYPTWLLRVFQRGAGRCESTLMDEHIIVDRGETIDIKADIIDRNNKDLSFWIDKHNRYASLEMQEHLRSITRGKDTKPDPLLRTGQARGKRWIKHHLYYHLPLFVRPFMYFIFRYFVRLGFLDGRQGLVFHFLQGFWYRFLVDAKLLESRLQNPAADKLAGS